MNKPGWRANNAPIKRTTVSFLFILLLMGLIALFGRVIYLQVCKGAEYARIARKQSERRIVIPARPGNIFARTRSSLILMAGSTRTPGLFVDPLMIGEEHFKEVASKVVSIIGGSADALYRKLIRNRGRRYVYLGQLSEKQVLAIKALKIRGVGITYRWRRRYPNGVLACHVIGFRRPDGDPGAGVEMWANHWLAGKDGLMIVHADAARKGNYADILRYESPKDGKDVILTLDIFIQQFLQNALRRTVEHFHASAGMGIVMDPVNGEILAMASVPGYDPNDYSRALASQRRNRVITDPFEPGSTMKPFIAIGAIQMGKVTLQSKFFCHHGIYHAHRGGTIRDFPGEHFGWLPLSEIVIHSSNIGMAKLGELLGNEELYRIVAAFGFGKRCGVELPGESPGLLLPLHRWTSYATRRVPFGQGPIAATCLQLACAFSAIANGGILLRPRIIDKVIDVDGEVVFQSKPMRVRRVISKAVARQFIDEVLVNVVKRGTGKKCKLERWTVFGKTGTGQIAGADGYIEHAYTASFMAGAPANQPRVVCVVSIYKPDYSIGHTGGEVAAPCVREVLQKTLSYLDVPPDCPSVSANSR
mgnify:CR=1 FL=1